MAEVKSFSPVDYLSPLQNAQRAAIAELARQERAAGAFVEAALLVPQYEKEKYTVEELALICDALAVGGATFPDLVKRSGADLLALVITLKLFIAPIWKKAQTVEVKESKSGNDGGSDGEDGLYARFVAKLKADALASELKVQPPARCTGCGTTQRSDGTCGTSLCDKYVVPKKKGTKRKFDGGEPLSVEELVSTGCFVPSMASFLPVSYNYELRESSSTFGISQWLLAFSAYSTQLVAAHGATAPTLAGHLSEHMCWVLAMAVDYDQELALAVDAKQRLKFAQSPTVSWSPRDRDSQLLLKFMPAYEARKASAARPARAAASAGSQSHSSGSSSGAGSRVRGICFRYNIEGGCRDSAADCSFHHVCQFCLAVRKLHAEHPAHMCTSIAAASGAEKEAWNEAVARRDLVLNGGGAGRGGRGARAGGGGTGGGGGRGAPGVFARGGGGGSRY